MECVGVKRVSEVQHTEDVMQIDLSQPCTTVVFANLVGLSRQRVSDLMADGTLKKGAPAHEWLTTYVAQLREVASGRGGDADTLSAERALQVKVARERDEIRLAVDRQEYAAVEVLERALATLGGRIVSALQPLHLKLQKRCPGLTPEGVALVQSEVAKACAMAESASLQALQPKVEDEESEQA